MFPESDDLEAATRGTPEVLRQLEPPMAQAGGSSGQHEPRADGEQAEVREHNVEELCPIDRSGNSRQMWS